MKIQLHKTILMVGLLFAVCIFKINAQQLIWELSDGFPTAYWGDWVKVMVKYDDSLFVSLGNTTAKKKQGSSGVAFLLLNANKPSLSYKDTLDIYGVPVGVLKKSNGNIIAAVSEYDFVSGLSFPTLIETDLSGGVIWRKSFSKISVGQNSVLKRINATPDGSYIVSGNLSVSGTASIFQPFVMKLDSMGNKIWEKVIPTYYLTECLDVNPNVDGSYLLSCSMSATLLSYKIDPHTGHVYDSVIVDTISNGFIENASIKQGPDGGYVATYRSNTITNQKAYIAKYDSAWKTQWKHQVGDHILEPFINKDTSVSSFGKSSFPGYQYTMGYTRRYKKDGTIMWHIINKDSSLFSVKNPRYYCVAYDENKEAVLAGEADQDFYFAKIANFGEPYEPDFCASSPAAAFTFSQTADSLFLIDSSYSGLSLNPHLSYEWYVDNRPLPKDSVTAMALTAQNYTKTKTVKLIIKNWYGCIDSVERVINLWPLGVQKKSLKQPQVKVFPNPARDLLTVQPQESGKLSIYSSTGQVVYERQVLAGKNKIEVSSYPKGVYLVRFVGEKGMTVRKVLVE